MKVEDYSKKLRKNLFTFLEHRTSKNFKALMKHFYGIQMNEDGIVDC